MESEFNESLVLESVLVTLTVTEPDTVEPAAGDTITSPLLTVIETEAVASTVPVDS
jgi:hypothetical protein